MENNIRIALTNLGKYNEGELNYVWLNLPASDEEMTKAFDAIGVASNTEYEEHFITDYEAPFSIGEYDNLMALNEKAEEFDALDEYEMMAFNACIDGMYDDINEALEVAQSGEYTVWHDVDNMGDVACEMVDQGYFGEIDESNPLHRYIDYDALGRDLDIEGTFVFIGSNCVEFHV